MAGAYFPITVEANARFDAVFHYCQPDDSRTRIPLTGFTPVMHVLRNGIVAVSSDLALPLLPGGITLTKNSAEIGRIDCSMLGDVTGSIFLPYGPTTSASYFLDLVDDAVPTNRIRMLYGPFLQEVS